MQKLLSSVALLALCASADAADILKLKAPAYVQPVCSAGSATMTPSCSGFYLGLNVQGIGSNLDILGSGINNSVFAGGGLVGLDAGYQFWNGTFFLAGEGQFDYDFQGSGLNAEPFNQRWSGDVLAKAGVGLSNILGIGQPNTTGPATSSQGPISLAVIPGTAFMSPYAVVGGAFKNNQQGWITGAGAEWILAQGWNLDIFYHHINWNATPTGVVGSSLVTPSTIENRVGFAFNRMF